jgi:hypothetical protein
MQSTVSTDEENISILSGDRRSNAPQKNGWAKAVLIGIAVTSLVVAGVMVAGFNQTNGVKKISKSFTNLNEEIVVDPEPEPSVKTQLPTEYSMHPSMQPHTFSPVEEYSRRLEDVDTAGKKKGPTKAPTLKVRTQKPTSEPTTGAPVEEKHRQLEEESVDEAGKKKGPTKAPTLKVRTQKPTSEPTTGAPVEEKH